MILINIDQQDGRVVILQSRKDHDLGMIGYLQAFISPVSNMLVLLSVLP